MNWVACKDRLPPASVESAICQYEIGPEEGACAGKKFVHELWCDQGFWAWGPNDGHPEQMEPVGQSGIIVTHWMRLPKST